MPRRPAGMRAMTPAERQRRYRRRRRELAGCEEMLSRLGLSRAELVKMEARPREAGAEGLARAAAERMVQLKIEALDAGRRLKDFRREAVALVARALCDGGDGTRRQQAENLLCFTIREEVLLAPEEYDLTPQDVWGPMRVSAPRGTQLNPLGA